MGYYGDMKATGTDMTQNQFDSSSSDGNPDTESFPAPRTSTSYAHDKAKIMARLRRMEGQVRGVQRMVEEDQYCLDVLTQLSAIIAAARQTDCSYSRTTCGAAFSVQSMPRTTRSTARSCSPS